MSDRARTKAQLMGELVVLRRQMAELETERQQREAEREQLLAAEREQRLLAEALCHTSAAISSSLKGEEVLDRILEEMSRVVAHDAACVLLIETDFARVFRWRGYVRSGRATRTAIVSAAFMIESIPALHTAHKTAEALVVPHPAKNDAWVRKFGTDWVRSYACAPIRIRGRVAGFLTVDSETPGFYRPTHADPLQTFADQAAIAIENVQLHNQVRWETAKRVKTLKKEQQLIKAVLDTTDAFMIAVDPQGRIVQFNMAYEQVSGYTLVEARGRYFWDPFLPPVEVEVVKQFFAHLHPDQLPARFENHLLPKMGQQRLIAWTHTALLDGSGRIKYVIATGIDITERKQIEVALQENEALLRATFEQLVIGINYTDLDGKFLRANQRFCQMLGYTHDEILNLSVAEVTHPDDRETDLTHLSQMAAGQLTSYVMEKRYIRKDGAYVWVNLTVSLVWVPSKALKYTVGVVEDITDRKRAEKALRLQYEQLQARNKELDAYARTVAHDLKNPLASLTGLAEVLAEDYLTISTEKLGEYLQSIVWSGQRASRIVEALLLLAGVRQQAVTPEPINMFGVVAETLERLAGMIAEFQAEIITPATWPTVMGYAPWIEAVWANYISNGLKYGGRPPQLVLGATIQENRMVRFWIKDNGSGLTPEAQARLFTEFTQLEPGRAEGSGLGLSIVRRIVEKLGGQVAVESEGKPGQGSTFSFTLPLDLESEKLGLRRS